MTKKFEESEKSRERDFSLIGFSYYRNMVAVKCGCSGMKRAAYVTTISSPMALRLKSSQSPQDALRRAISSTLNQAQVLVSGYFIG
jgi:hypothetical protein